MPVRPRISFARQVLILQVGVVVVVAVLGYGLVAWMLDGRLRDQYGQRALTVARSVAVDPQIAAAVAAGDPGGLVQDRAERVRVRTGALFVVVTDNRGLRLSHPNPLELGRHVSTDPSDALAGREVVRVERGTLGLSARGKVPLYGPDGRILGEVSVGFDARAIDRELGHVLREMSLFVAGAVLLGVVASAAIGRRLKRQTLGLEPYELVELVHEREAVLHGVGEGVVAVDTAGRIAVCNDEASRLLGVAPERGAPAGGLAAEGRCATSSRDGATPRTCSSRRGSASSSSTGGRSAGTAATSAPSSPCATAPTWRPSPASWTRSAPSSTPSGRSATSTPTGCTPFRACSSSATARRPPTTSAR